MTTHKRETTIGRKYTEEEAAHIERGAVYLVQAKSNKFFSSIEGRQMNFFHVLRIEDTEDEGWVDKTLSLPFAGFIGVEDTSYKSFVRFATEEECKRFDMPYIPMPAKPTHLKVAKD